MYPNTPHPTRTLVSARIPEYLENLKAEFESLAHDVNMYKMQRDDYERKLQGQLGELSSIQQTLYDLERNHSKIKQQYEEEIMRLRRQVELHGGTPGGTSVPVNNPPLPPFPQTTSTGGPNSVGGPSGPTVPAIQPLPPRGMQSPDKVSSMINPSNNVGGSMFYGGLAPIDTSRKYPQPTGQQATSTSNNNKRPREPIQPFSGPPTATPLNPEPKVIKQEIPKESPIQEVPMDEKMKHPSKTQDENGSILDWIVGYNPGVQTNLNIDLAHSLDHSSVVCCVKFSNDGKHLATGCNKSAQIYDVETGVKVHTFSEEPLKDGDLYIRSVCFSPDNKYLAAGAEDKTVKLWDIEQKRLHHTFTGHDLDIYSLDFSRDGNLIVSGSGDKKAKIWNVDKGECVFTLGHDEVGPKDGVTSVAFSPDGRLVAAGSLDRIVRLWDAQTGYFLERYEGHSDSVYSVAFSPDGKSLASGSLDKTLKLWDLSSSRSRSRCRSTFSGHKDFVLSVAFSPDGRWLISGSKDRSVQFWDPRTAVTHMMLQGHKNSVISVAVSPIGGIFATGSGDFRARMWKYNDHAVASVNLHP